MVSRGIRTDVVPKDVILQYIQNGALPVDYTHDATFDGKLIRGAPAGCNPGGCVGAANHTHSSAGGHAHSVTASGSHTHSVISAGPSATEQEETSTTKAFATSTHTHSGTSGTASPTATADCQGAHTQPTQTHAPAGRTIRHIKKGSLISLRQKLVPRNVTVYWKNVLSSIPSEYVLVGGYFDKFIDSVANAGACPGTNTGAVTHIHADTGAHTHLVTAATHAHSGDNTGTGASTGNIGGGAGGILPSSTHTHTGTLTPVTAVKCVSSVSGGGSHCHGTGSNNPAHVTLALITKSSISMRQTGLPQASVVEWLNTLASIPSDYALSDGIGDTLELRSKYIKVIPNDSTDPGCALGSDTHTHSSSVGAHTHTAALAHTHTQTGSLAANTVTIAACNGNDTIIASDNHTHAAAATTGSGTQNYNLTSLGNHTHSSASALPQAKEVAFIQRL